MSEAFVTPLPLSLYVHYPWCVRKCPYCDFSSFKKGDDKSLDERYLHALMLDFDKNLSLLNGRKLISVYLGGGTPSLCPPEITARFIAHIRPYLADGCEISMEANPGTVSEKNFEGYLKAGVNRLSIGVQSFDDASLKTLGRIHNGKDAENAISMALSAGFTNINCDLMHALPHQDIAMAMRDLELAAAFDITHISWYELTIEEGTLFGRHPPEQPDEDLLAKEEEMGFSLLKSLGFERYEVSAFARAQKKCVHNRNYWLFNDYLGIGAGGCGKILIDGVTRRRSCHEDPVSYMQGEGGDWYDVPKEDLPFEFALNRLRLFEEVDVDEFFKTSCCSFGMIEEKLKKAADEGLLVMSGHSYKLTHLGQRMLNDILELFL